MSVLALLGRLATLETRAQTAGEVATALGAEDLILFIRDRELGILLPAAGFPQTIRNGAAWQAFLDGCLADGEGSGRMPTSGTAADRPARGYRVDEDAVLVLIGGAPRPDQVAEILPVLPLMTAVVAGEHASRALTAQADLARTSAAKGEVLATALERSRDRLREALDAATEARLLVEQQAEELAATAEELERSQEELVAINDDLRETNDALESTAHDAERARDQADEANRSKANFLASMSHELRTPLNAIGGYAALLEEEIAGPITAGQRNYLERIKRSQAHLSGLINDVLNFAKVEAGAIAYHLDAVELEPVLSGVGILIEPQARARRITYRYVPPQADVVVTADRDKVVQVILNLLTNAVKFTPPGGTVTLETEVRGELAHIRIADSGPGIPEDRLTSIFEPFVQLERSLTQDRHGVGLGLTISRELARGMGGDLQVESTLGRGSAFIFLVPRHAAVPAQAQRA